VVDIKIITIINTDAGALWAGYPEAELFNWIPFPYRVRDKLASKW